MAEVVRKAAAPGFIFRDVRLTMTNAFIRGGLWKSHAESQLTPVVSAMDNIETRIAEAEGALVSVQAELDLRQTEANELLGRVSDEIWNDAGRPRTDAGLTMLFPGGVAYYTRGHLGEQPKRMEVLAELVESGLHLRTTPEKATAYATQIRASAAALKAALEAASGPRERLRQLERVRRTIANAAQAGLANLKRLYKVERFSEADIHAVIPARPVVSKKAAPANDTSAPTGQVPAPTDHASKGS